MKTYQIHGKILRDIPILPDHISSRVEGWRMQAWYGFDPRVKLGDILARIGKTINHNTALMRSKRFREDFPALGWANKGPKSDAEKLRIEEQMGIAGLDPATGTTRGLAWGLVDPDNEDSGHIAIPGNKAWENSVEDPTAAHFINTPSSALSGHSQPVMTNTPMSQDHHDNGASDVESEDMSFDYEEDREEEHVEMLDTESPDAPAVQPLSEYPRPEEVPRPISITDPILYRQMFDEEDIPLQYHPCF